VRLGGDSAGRTPLKAITVSAPGSPAAAGACGEPPLPAVREAAGEDATSPASAAGAGAGAGAAFSPSPPGEGGGGGEGGADTGAVEGVETAAGEGEVGMVTAVAEEGGSGDAPLENASPLRSAAAVAAAIESASGEPGGGDGEAGERGGARALPGAPWSPAPAAPQLPPLALLPGEVACAKCGARAAARRAALAPGSWAPVCGPCGDALDSGKALGGLLDQVTAALQKVFVPPEEEAAQ